MLFSFMPFAVFFKTTGSISRSLLCSRRPPNPRNEKKAKALVQLKKSRLKKRNQIKEKEGKTKLKIINERLESRIEIR